MLLSLIRVNSLADPRQRVADEHIYHARAAEPSVHYDYSSRFFAHLPDDRSLFCRPRYANQRSALLGMISLFSEPVVNVQSLDAFEMPLVVGHQTMPSDDRGRSDQDVSIAD